MDLKTGKKTLGKTVLAYDKFNGSYIGLMLDLRQPHGWVASVAIIACKKYPEQCAQFWPEKVFERKPYPYASIQKFNLKDVERYAGEVPEYMNSVEKALAEKRINAEGKTAEILGKHLRELERENTEEPAHEGSKKKKTLKEEREKLWKTS